MDAQVIVDTIKHEIAQSPSTRFTTISSSILRDVVRALDSARAEKAKTGISEDQAHRLTTLIANYGYAQYQEGVAEANDAEDYEEAVERVQTRFNAAADYIAKITSKE